MPNATQQPIQETNSQTTQQPPNNTPILVQNNAIDEKEMKIKRYAVKSFIKQYQA